MHATEIPDSSIIQADADVATPSDCACEPETKNAKLETSRNDDQLEIPEAASGAPPNSKFLKPPLACHETPTNGAPHRRRRWQRFVRRGRPSTFNEDIADAMYESILEAGVTDSRAGLLANVSTSTVSRWKKQDPNFADFLETARTHFEFEEVKKIRHAKRRDGQPNAQNAKWLLQHTNPEVWGGRARQRHSNAVPSRPDLHQNDINYDRFAAPQQSNSHPIIPENAPSDAPSSVAPSNHPSQVKPTSHPASQDSSSPNQLRSPASEPASCESRTPFVDPEWDANLLENEALRDAVIAEIAELESAHFHAAQQSKSQQNIPVIQPPDRLREAAGAVLVVGRGEPGTSVLRPEQPVGILPVDASVPPPDPEAALGAVFPRNRKERRALERARHQSKNQRNIPEIPPETL